MEARVTRCGFGALKCCEMEIQKGMGTILGSFKRNGSYSTQVIQNGFTIINLAKNKARHNQYLTSV